MTGAAERLRRAPAEPDRDVAISGAAERCGARARVRRNAAGNRPQDRRPGGYSSRRPSIALWMVTSSAYSMSLPTGSPIAMRVTRTPSGFSSFAR